MNVLLVFLLFIIGYWSCRLRVFAKASDVCMSLVCRADSCHKRLIDESTGSFEESLASFCVKLLSNLLVVLSLFFLAVNLILNGGEDT
jgi:hypothetical protein